MLRVSGGAVVAGVFFKVKNMGVSAGAALLQAGQKIVGMLGTEMFLYDRHTHRFNFTDYALLHLNLSGPVVVAEEDADLGEVPF